MLSNTIKIITVSSLLFAFGCASDDSSSSTGAGFIERGLPGTDVDLAAVSNGECLNLQALMGEMSNLHLTLPARRIVTSVDSSNYASSNFPLLRAVGNLDITDDQLGNLGEVLTVTQEGCEKVTISDPRGGEEYKVTKSSEDSITITSMWEDIKTYKWISRNHIQITETWPFPDGCGDKTKSKVTTVKHIMWDQGAQSEAISANLMDSEFINLLTRATGYPKSALYAAADGTPLSGAPGVPVAPPAPPAPELPPDPNAPADQPSTSPTPTPETPVDPGNPSGPLVSRFIVLDAEDSGGSYFSVSRLRSMAQTPTRPDLTLCH